MLKSKIMSADEAVSVIKSGDTIMIGEFGNEGCATHVIDALNRRTDLRDLTIISCNTGSTDGLPCLVELMGSDKIKKLICSYPRNNPNSIKKILSGEIESEVIPMGTFIERIRSGGAGIGGIFTEAGIGTHIEEGKIIKEFNGKKYMFEPALHADVAIVFANKADEWGNLYINAMSQNFNNAMATAAKYVIAQADEIVPVGGISPEKVRVPAAYVNAIVKAGE